MEEAQVPQDGAQEGCGDRQVQQVQRAGKVAQCEKHQEPLKVFCRKDLAFICLVCNMSKLHRNHEVLPLEEAAQDFKEEIQIKLQKLQKEVTTVQGLMFTQKQETTECLEDLNLKKKEIMQEFQQFYLFLEEQKGHLLDQLNRLEEEIKKLQEENLIKLSNNVSALEDLLKDLEREHRRPDGEFLQNLKETLSRCEKGTACWPVQPVQQVQQLSNLRAEQNEVSQKSHILTEMFEKFKDTLEAKLKSEREPCLNGTFKEYAVHSEDIWSHRAEDLVRTFRKENVELDQHTANPKLMVAWNGRIVRHREEPQILPDNPQRFDSEPFVLGCVGFSSGRQCWVVSVEQGQSWAVGVAKESVKRKGTISISPEQGIWAVEQCWGQFQALTSRWTSLTLLRKPRRIRVCLDYERGWVSFFDADLDAQIFTFPPISFNQEIIYPWFWVGPGSHLSLSP